MVLTWHAVILLTIFVEHVQLQSTKSSTLRLRWLFKAGDFLDGGPFQLSWNNTQKHFLWIILSFALSELYCDTAAYNTKHSHIVSEDHICVMLMDTVLKLHPSIIDFTLYHAFYHREPFDMMEIHMLELWNENLLEALPHRWAGITQ